MPDDPVPAAPASPAALAITPADATVTASKAVQFSIAGAAPEDVTWSVSPEPPGIFHAGVFLAADSVPASSLHTVTARTADGRTATALLRVVAISVALMPKTARLRSEERQQFTAIVHGDPANGVTWNLVPQIGSIADGVYTPPSGSIQTEAVDIIASSTLDPSQCATVTVTLIKPPPMAAGLRRSFGIGLVLLCIAICGLTLAFWPMPNVDVAAANADSEKAAQVLRAAQDRATSARQAVEQAKKAQQPPADAKKGPDPGLQGLIDQQTAADAQVAAALKDLTDKTSALKQAQDAFVTVPGRPTTPMPRELNYLILALVLGALGSFVHTAKSFAGFAGNRALVASWAWWYILQPFIGMTLALLFYVVVRGGFFATGAGPSAVNPYGIAAVSGMVGMFSKQASDKLNELFSTLFKTSEDAQRKDKMTVQPVPTPAAGTSTTASKQAGAAS